MTGNEGGNVRFTVPDTVTCSGATLYPDGRIDIDSTSGVSHYRDMGTAINDMSNILLASRVFQSMHLMAGLHRDLSAAGFVVLPLPYESVERNRDVFWAPPWSAAMNVLPDGMHHQFLSMANTLWGLPTPDFEVEPGEWAFGSPVVGVHPGNTVSHTGDTRNNELNSVYVTVNVHPLGVQGSALVEPVGAARQPISRTQNPRYGAWHFGQYFYLERFTAGAPIPEEEVSAIRQTCAEFDREVVLTGFALDDALDLPYARTAFVEARLKVNARKRLKPYRLNQATREAVADAMKQQEGCGHAKGLILNFRDADEHGRGSVPVDSRQSPTWYGVVADYYGTREEMLEAANLLHAALPAGKRCWQVLVDRPEQTRSGAIQSPTPGNVLFWVITVGYQDLPWEKYWPLLGTTQYRQQNTTPFHHLTVI